MSPIGPRPIARMLGSLKSAGGGDGCQCFVEGIDRSQRTLFPAMLDDYVAEVNPVRAVSVVEGHRFVSGYRPAFGSPTGLIADVDRSRQRQSRSDNFDDDAREVGSVCATVTERQRISAGLADRPLALDFRDLADLPKDNAGHREVCRNLRGAMSGRTLICRCVASVAIDWFQIQAGNARISNFGKPRRNGVLSIAERH